MKFDLELLLSKWGPESEMNGRPEILLSFQTSVSAGETDRKFVRRSRGFKKLAAT